MSDQKIRLLPMPKWGMAMKEGTLLKWLVEEGTLLSLGQEVAEVETDKITGLVEATDSGVLRRTVAGPGDVVAVGMPIAVIADHSVSEDEIDAFIAKSGQAAEVGDQGPTGAPSPEERVEVAEPVAGETGSATSAAQGRIKASPVARKMAKERGIDLTLLTGTGPDGRIVGEDVERASEERARETAKQPGPSSATAAVIALSAIRRTIARRLSDAWQAPHFSVSMSADVSRVIELRAALAERTPADGAKPTYSDILTKLCAVALIRHPALNAHFEDDEIRVFPTANVGIAVAVADGLLVPVLRNVENKSIADIAAARTDLVTRTREGRLALEEMEGGTFSISNLGMYEVERFVAIINPPQVAVLAVGAIKQNAVVAEGVIVARPCMNMTVSCDHRAVDGATAAEFLRTLKHLLEAPGLAL